MWSIAHQPSPPGALDPKCRGVELFLQVVEPAKVLVNRGLERAVLKDAAGSTLVVCGGEVLPEERVVDVPRDGGQ
jgi:hypothetical protein